MNTAYSEDTLVEQPPVALITQLVYEGEEQSLYR